MNDFNLANSKEEAFNLLDAYAIQQRLAVKKRKLSPESGVIKSYMLEKENTEDNVEDIFRESALLLSPIDEGFFRIAAAEETYGFLESVNSRYLILHTVQISNKSDAIVKQTVNDSSQLDYVWLSGHYLNSIWDAVIKEQYANKYIKMQFQYNDIFRRELISENLINTAYEYDVDEEEVYVEEVHRQSSLSIGMTATKIANVLSGLQDTLEDFKVMTRLRMPSPFISSGGYDFWNWGKVTYRSSNFRDGLKQVYGTIELYQKVTELIEKIAWFHTEKTNMGTIGEAITFTGAPISFVFPIPLDIVTFQNFVTGVFVKGHNEFRLWGNPIYLSDSKVHVYGIDMHLWQKVYFELSPSRFNIILPKNTCGNTVHRLVSNIQRYLAPDVEVYIGDYSYKEIIFDILLGRGEIQ